MTIIALFCVDKFGRRKFLVTGAILMGISILTLGIVCHFEQSGTPAKTCVDQTSCRNTNSANNKNYFNQTSTLEQIISTTHSNNHHVDISKNISHTLIVTTTAKIDLKHMTSGSQSNSTESQHQSRSVIKRDSSQNVLPTTESSVPGNNVSDSGNGTKSSLVQKIIGFSALMTYVAAYGFSFGPGK